MTALVFTDYTSPDIVRGFLGIAEQEIPDDIFTTMSGTFLLEIEETLNELNDSVTSMFSTIKAISAGSRTAAQTRFYSIVQLYAACVTADDIANGSVEMFAPIQITDGKAKEVRANDPYESLRTSLKASLTIWRTRLGSALTTLDPTKAVSSVAPLLVVGVGIALDPVTGV